MIRLGEPIFGPTIQGEGSRTGVLSVWVRFFGCSLKCKGFSQPDPADTSTYIEPVFSKPIKEFTSLLELPVIERGCDSLYSIDSRFKHLATIYESEKELVDDIIKLLYNEKFYHPVSFNEVDLCFTGGEPLLNQKAILSILDELQLRRNIPSVVQFETNGTKELTSVFNKKIASYQEKYETKIDLHFNISPKLFHVSGERNEDAINLKAIKSITDEYNGCLKFVINNDTRAWDELNSLVKDFRASGIWYPIYIMPVGATKEQQEDLEHINKIAEKALSYGYHISGRLHANLFGNTVGV